MKKYLLPILGAGLVIASQMPLLVVHAAESSIDQNCLEAIYTGTSTGSIDDCIMVSLGIESTTSTALTTNTSTTSSIVNTGVTQTESGIDLNAASILPALAVTPMSTPSNYQYSAWELLHRTPMLAGYVWTGPIANYITPAMYEGTPFSNGNSDIGYFGSKNPMAEDFIKKSETYAECLRNETFISFGLGQSIESNDILELKAIAKTCAIEFYGSYFTGKSYTTREEFLLMLFTLFGEDVSLEGKFVGGDFISNGKLSDTPFANISKSAWYAPYLEHAYNLALLPVDEVKWQVGKIITDKEIVEMLAFYTSYRMNFSGEALDRGVIDANQLRYSISFPDTDSISLRIQ